MAIRTLRSVAWLWIFAPVALCGCGVEAAQNAADQLVQPPPVIVTETSTAPRQTVILGSDQRLATPDQLDSLVAAMGECVSKTHRFEVRYRRDAFVGLTLGVVGSEQRNDTSGEETLSRCDGALGFSIRSGQYADRFPATRIQEEAILDEFITCSSKNAGSLHALVVDRGTESLVEANEILIDIVESTPTLNPFEADGLLACVHGITGPLVVFEPQS